MNFLGGMKILWIFFGVITGAIYLGAISMHFGVFSQSQCTEWGILLGVAKISNIFWGA